MFTWPSRVVVKSHEGFRVWRGTQIGRQMALDQRGMCPEGGGHLTWPRQGPEGQGSSWKRWCLSCGFVDFLFICFPLRKKMWFSSLQRWYSNSMKESGRKLGAPLLQCRHRRYCQSMLPDLTLSLCTGRQRCRSTNSIPGRVNLGLEELKRRKGKGGPGSPG